MRKIVVLFLFTVQISKGQSLTNSPDSTQWTSISRESYSISYPASWTIDSSKNLGIDLYIFAKADSPTDKFRENINVLFSNVEGLGVTLDTLVKVLKKQIESLATEVNFLESKLYNLGGKIYHKIEFTTKQGIFDLHFVQYYFATAKKVYTVTFTCEQDKYDFYIKDAMKVLDSFAASGN